MVYRVWSNLSLASYNEIAILFYLFFVVALSTGIISRYFFERATSVELAKTVESATTKTGYTSCTNWTISFKVRGFETKTHLFQRHFILLNLFQLKTFFAFNMQHSKPHTKISTLSDFTCYFSCI